MFFIKSKEKKDREKAVELVRLGQKVYDYRHDILKDSDVTELRRAIESLKKKLKDKEASLEEVKKGRDRLHKIAKKCGGSLYPVGFWAENSEMFLVAAILALGIRTFFLQPFTIPTNSMYPSYYGMTSKVYTSEEQKPGLVKRAMRAVFFGSSNYTVKAKGEGELLIPILSRGGGLGSIKYERARGFKFFILPIPKRLYTFYVGGEPVKVTVPWDFSLDDVVRQMYYPELDSYPDMLRRASALGNITMVNGEAVIKTGIELTSGDKVLDFDILGGDMLFVDRVSYHFRKPKIGDPIVFRTEKIERMRKPDGSPEEKYFIKRLVGLGGDELEVREPVLYRNGEPIEGAEAFNKNSDKEGLYGGYLATMDLSSGETQTVPEGYFYAMGDNSYHSADSRFWGAVPEKEAVGKAIFVFYPFNKRWGISD